MFESFLELFVIIILIIKIFFLLSLVKLIYYKIFDSDNKDGIEKTSERNENIDWLFFTFTFILMIYLFNLRYKNSITIDGHTKTILFACGVVGLIHQLKEKFIH